MTFINIYQQPSKETTTMFRILKNGFIPSSSSSLIPSQKDETRYEILKFVADISNQINENKTVTIQPKDGTELTTNQLTALAEIIAQELIYYGQLCEIGGLLATSLLDEENEQESLESDDEEDCGFLQRTASCAAPSPKAESPKSRILSQTLLVASGQIRKMISELFMKLALPKELFLLGPAGYQNAHDVFAQQHHFGLLVQPLFVRLCGGRQKSVETKSGMTIDEVLNEIASIAKHSWTLMNLCGMLQIFRFSADIPLFTTIKIDPIESIFGNNGWKQIEFHKAAVWNFPTRTHEHCESDDVPSSTPQQWESDDVPSSTPQQWESDDVPSRTFF